METRKKYLPTNAPREHINPGSCKLQKKVTSMSEKKVAGIITSAKKQKSVRISPRTDRHVEYGRNLNLEYVGSYNENRDSCFTYQTSVSHKDVEAANCMTEMIFSPSFHHTKDFSGGVPDKVGSKELSKMKDIVDPQNPEVHQSQVCPVSCDTIHSDNECTNNRTTDSLTVACEKNIIFSTISCKASDMPDTFHLKHEMELTHATTLVDDEYSHLGNFSNEVSAIYLAIQNSKLECVDEHSQDTTSTDGCVEPDEMDEFDDFDPYFFIKDLPDLSAVVPRFRPTLLPKQTRSCPSTTLVLDLDETLVHSTLEPCEGANFTFPVNFNLKEHTIYVRCRPFLKDFLEKVAGLFETIIFTASQSIYAEQLLNILDPGRKLLRHRVYRDSCVFIEGNYLKDLSILGRDLSHVVIVDNSPQAFGFQLDNGIPIVSWFDNPDDRELLTLLPFLESLVGANDVRPLISKKFNLREKVVAQRTKEAEVTEQDSLLLTRNLLRIAIFNISYIRGLFPEKYFNDKSVPALEMKIKKLMPMDAESRRLIDWMERGVYDALQKKYLKTLLFSICEEKDGPMIEEYAFSFSYASSDGDEVCMKVSRNGNKKNGMTFKSTDVTPDQMRSSACKMIRTLVSLMRTLDQMPEERTILMKLLYYDGVTPEDYEPPFFRKCSENEVPNTWTKNPLKMEVGNVNSKHVFLSLKVKSVLDPCEDENGLAEDEEVSLGDDSVQGNDSSSDSEIHPSLAEKFIVAPIAKKHPREDNGIVSDDETQDASHEDEQTARVRDWLNSTHVTTVHMADILANFPNISVVYINRLMKEGLIFKVGKDSYTITKVGRWNSLFNLHFKLTPSLTNYYCQEINSKTCPVKEEAEMQDIPKAGKNCKNMEEGHMYMKALYHALPMDYVSVAKLQSKLEGEASNNTVRKLIDKMEQDGYIKNTGNRRLGKRVIHSESSNRKLLEVKKLLEKKPMVISHSSFPCKTSRYLPADTNMNDGASTFGGLHSIGSDLTRTQAKAKLVQSGPLQSDQTANTKDQERSNAPSGHPVSIASLESAVAGERGNGIAPCPGEDSQSTQDKRLRKSSTVEEPILQYVKRQKSQA
ncbi:hypothetical protein Cni_G05334 [Canna indica]|uniref:Uncharacterized protein n=1 Tax=Canna indica TaxID=4628 RepID=A0AAQ3JV00_9LILI|nr:hypothetical protein Cni_G05334 [Canna indica]